MHYVKAAVVGETFLFTEQFFGERLQVLSYTIT